MKILLFANTDWYLFNFRLKLAERLHAEGYEILMLSPRGEYSLRLEEKGFRWQELSLSRRGLNPVVEAFTIWRLIRIYQKEQPDLVHHFTIKSVLYGSLAARLAGIRSVVNSITGLGYVFLPGGVFKTILRSFILLLYRIAMRGTQVIFENEDDQNTFLRYGFIRPEDGYLIPGVGVDTDRFVPGPEPDGTPVALFASRLLWDKGVGEFVHAARLIQKQGIQARFVLAGRTDPGNPASVSMTQIEAWRDEGVIEWWGWVEDMAALFQQANIVCLPSYYREGLPTVLSEAAACGRPIVTTDHPGCRDAVKDGETGVLVPVKDPVSLAAALGTLLGDAGLRQKMGNAGRLYATQNLSAGNIITKILEVYSRALLQGA
ncbi:MAG: glycosyltransferase family 4 protein [Chloroflexota bacterium]